MPKINKNKLPSRHTSLGYDRAPTVTISQNDPLPLKVLGMSLELQFK